MPSDAEHLAVEPENKCGDSPTQRDGVPRDRVEHGLRVRGRAGDYLEDVTCRRQVAVPCLQLLEQPHVLDGNDGLVGEGCHQLDLLVGERLRLGFQEGNDAKERALTQHWDREYRAVTLLLHQLAHFVVGVLEDVPHMYRPTLKSRPSRYRTSA